MINEYHFNFSHLVPFPSLNLENYNDNSVFKMLKKECQNHLPMFEKCKNFKLLANKSVLLCTNFYINVYKQHNLWAIWLFQRERVTVSFIWMFSFLIYMMTFFHLGENLNVRFRAYISRKKLRFPFTQWTGACSHLYACKALPPPE